MKRTNIVLDESLLNEGKKATGLKTSKAVVDFALKELLRHHNQKRILELRGQVKWVGNLEKMRLARGV
ncbi:MAG: type II toxin-antitoxin system VapB family antitoxin [Chitinivibrionales bacterium]|jgi:Arc/MetJ family transcription regulator